MTCSNEDTDATIQNHEIKEILSPDDLCVQFKITTVVIKRIRSSVKNRKIMETIPSSWVTHSTENLEDVTKGCTHRRENAQSQR